MPILKREPDAYPESIFEIKKNWWVAHVRSRQEKSFARYLRDHEIPFYLPQIEKRVRRSGRLIVSHLPLFSGYVFFKGTTSDADRALRSHLVANLLQPNDERELAAELCQLHKLQLDNRKLTLHPYLAPGDAVTIVEGAFAGYRGVVVREHGTERLVVSVVFIRQSVAVDIDRDFVKPRQNESRSTRR